jgi:hypothetical protein
LNLKHDTKTTGAHLSIIRPRRILKNFAKYFFGVKFVFYLSPQHITFAFLFNLGLLATAFR